MQSQQRIDSASCVRRLKLGIILYEDPSAFWFQENENQSLVVVQVLDLQLQKVEIEYLNARS
jgi:hypothetical protein